MVDPREMIKKFAGFSVVPIFSALLTLFVIPVISNVFPVEEYGKINMFYTVGMLLVTFYSLGLDHSFIRYYFEPPEGLTRRSMQAIVLVVGIAIDTFVLLLVLFLFSDVVSSYLFGDRNYLALVLLAVFTAGLIIFRQLNSDARMQENYHRYNLQSILQNTITRVSFVFVAFVSTSYMCSIVAMTIGMLGLSIVFLFVQRKTISFHDAEITSKNMKVLVLFGLPAMATTIVLNLNGAIGKIILSGGGFFGEVGILAIATTLSNVFTVLPTAFATYWSPFMYKNYLTEQGVISRVHDYIMFISGLIVSIIIIGQETLFLIVGGEYAVSQTFFMLIMLNPVQALICETTSYGVVLEEKPIINAVVSAIGVCVSALTTYLLMGALGAMAAALGVAFSSMIIGVLRTVFGQKYYKTISHPVKTIFSSIVIVLLCGANTFTVGSLYGELILGFSGLCAFLIVYWKEATHFCSMLKGQIKK